MQDISYAPVLMASEVPTELHALLGFGSELQLDELFNMLWGSVKSVITWIYIEFIVQACMVDNQDLDWRPLVHAHDLSGTILCGVRLGRLPGGRIRCHLQPFYIALLCLLFYQS